MDEGGHEARAGRVVGSRRGRIRRGDRGALEIVFRSGTRYRYYAVPRSVHRALLAADSKGKAFSELIRDRYPTEQLD